MSNLDLLPRADLPVIWDAFKAQAEPVRQIAETLTVTDISQKEEMALARKTRLTLREIRIAVEHKRVELGEGHLKEIQKVNGAARAIREFIEPLEARLLVQEEFAERAEDERILKLASYRRAELSAVRPGGFVSELGSMSQPDYDALLASYREEKAELEEANRLRVEAEKRLAEQAIEMRRQEEAFLEKLQAEKVAENARLAEVQRVALDVKQRSDAEAERQRKESAAILNAKLEQQRKEAEALEIQRTAEHKAEREEYERKAQVAREEAEANARAEATYLRQEQERLRIRDEQLAVLEAELAQERAAKQAEADAARKLALAPDVEKLRAFWVTMRSIQNPELKTDEAIACLMQARYSFSAALSIIETFCMR